MPGRYRLLTRFRCVALAAAGVLGAAATRGGELPSSASGSAASHPGGPRPTAAGLYLAGPFTTRTLQLPAREGFVGARVWFPIASDAGPYGVVAMAAPVRDRPEPSAAHISSHGFVVVLISVPDSMHAPGPLARQLGAAFKWPGLAGVCQADDCKLLRERADTDRRAMVGVGAGGGAALLGAAADPSLKAVVAVEPHSVSPSALKGLTVPVLNTVYEPRPAVVRSRWVRGYHEAIPATTPKSYLAIGPAFDHENDYSRGAVIAWLKRFVDGDTRYAPILCSPDRSVGDVRTHELGERNYCQAPARPM